MASKIHATLEEGPPDKEQASRDPRISVVSRGESSLPSNHLNILEKTFFIIEKGLAPSTVRPKGVYWR